MEYFDRNASEHLRYRNSTEYFDHNTSEHLRYRNSTEYFDQYFDHNASEHLRSCIITEYFDRNVSKHLRLRIIMEYFNRNASEHLRSRIITEYFDRNVSKHLRSRIIMEYFDHNASEHLRYRNSTEYFDHNASEHLRSRIISEYFDRNASEHLRSHIITEYFDRNVSKHLRSRIITEYFDRNASEHLRSRIILEYFNRNASEHLRSHIISEYFDHFIKVIKEHSNDFFNNYIDKFITHTDELSNLVFKPNNLNNLDYISRWNNIIIECNLHQFLKKKSMVQYWEKFLNLNRNGKYRHPYVNVDWHYTFLLLNRDIEDKVESTYFTSMFSLKRKKQSVNLLTEEIPIVEKRKYLAHKIFDNWKCFFCEQHDETFDHVWMSKKDPIIDSDLINKMTFWDRTYSETKITFIDLIKGIISCELAAYTSLIFENKKLQEKFLVLLRNFIFNKSLNFWINRCSKQKEKERRLKVNLKKVKENLNEDKYIDPNRKINQLNLFSGVSS
ncbi:hypothetical protein RhiirA1_467542 [Rhizophagus irregularis]|uniref:Uncharacterized protein n=1 Tax=Rhizophagus irregularis TaxID=588596 RepID=A0A2N0RBX5_9GLOM|nr:hypothetical protein RhiirA1_467542 [Rhizophagus irregularis]